MTELVIPRIHWTRTKYRRMAEISILEDGKVELVNGKIGAR